MYQCSDIWSDGTGMRIVLTAGAVVCIAGFVIAILATKLSHSSEFLIVELVLQVLVIGATVFFAVYFIIAARNFENYEGGNIVLCKYNGTDQEWKDNQTNKNVTVHFSAPADVYFPLFDLRDDVDTSDSESSGSKTDPVKPVDPVESQSEKPSFEPEESSSEPEEASYVPEKSSYIDFISYIPSIIAAALSLVAIPLAAVHLHKSLERERLGMDIALTKI